MANYSAVITLKGHTEKQIEDKLRAAFGASIVDEVQISESDPGIGCYYFCRSNNHFGCVHWTEEDLRTKFDELQIPITREMLDVVKSSYLLRHIDDRMVEVEWEIVEQAIADAQSRGKPNAKG